MRGGALLTLLALAAACGEPRAAEPGSRASAPEPPAALERAAEPLPAAGLVRVARRGERYDVLASEAPPRAALTELAALAGFRIEPDSADLPAAPVRLELRDVRLEDALRAILRGVAYDAHYEHASRDAERDARLAAPRIALTRITLAPSRSAAETARAERPAPPSAHGRERGGPAPPGEDDRLQDAERERLRAEAEAVERERAEAVERDWRDARTGVRLEAIERMEPDAQADRERLAVLLRDDPSAEVRMAAAERLAEGDPFAVSDTLLEALDDADPEVVASAVRGLEDVYAEAPDPRIRERVTALREHRDAEVREAVSDFEAWIDE